MERENTKTQMRKGALEFCILLVIAGRGRAYASEIIGELRKADLIVVEGTVYPLLGRLRSAGLLEHTWEESKSGPPRKYYALTPRGVAALEELKSAWKSLSATISSLNR